MDLGDVYDVRDRESLAVGSPVREVRKSAEAKANEIDTLRREGETTSSTVLAQSKVFSPTKLSLIGASLGLSSPKSTSHVETLSAKPNVAPEKTLPLDGISNVSSPAHSLASGFKTNGSTESKHSLPGLEGLKGRKFNADLPTESLPVASSSKASSKNMTAAQLSHLRSKQIDKRQQELAAIVDRHDDFVRELFHLDRFVTLIGYDPAVAKEDRSDVFTTFQNSYDLFLNAVPDTGSSGLSRRATRRVATDRKGLLAVATPVVSTSLTNNSRITRHGHIDKAEDPSRSRRRSSAGDTAKALYVSMPIHKKRVGRPSKYEIEPQTEEIKPSFSAPSPGSFKRIKLTHSAATTRYTHHLQVPKPASFGRSLPRLLSSYLALDEDINPALIDVELKAAYEAGIFLRIEQIKDEGRLVGNPNRQPSKEYKRSKDHQDWLIEHALYFSKLVHDETKAHMSLARKTSRMVLSHFDRLKGKDERISKEEERNRKALARWTIREVRKKWKLAVNVVKARRKAYFKAEKDRLGKQQLHAMLDKSTTMLQAQQVEMAAESDASDSDEEETDQSDAGDNVEMKEREEDGSEEEDEVEEDEEKEEEEEKEGDVDDEGLIIERNLDSDEVADESKDPTENEVDGTRSSQAVDDSTSSESGSSFGSSLPTRKGIVSKRQSRLSITSAPTIYENVSVDGSSGQDTDPELGDDEVFQEEDDHGRSEEDEILAEEMDEDEEDSDGELGGLADDAELPIEELLRRSGYASMIEEDASNSEAVALEIESEKSDSVLGKDVHDIRKVRPPSDTEPMLKMASDEDEKEAEELSAFGSDNDEARADEDEMYENDMEIEEEGAESDDSEIAGLAGEANMPIEELMSKYGLQNGSATAHSSDPETDTILPESPLTMENSSHNLSNVYTRAESVSGSTEEENEDSDESNSSKDLSVEEDGDDADIHSLELDADEKEEASVADRPSLRPPFLLRGSLRPYQQAGLEWLASLYANGVNGILADEMGLGKTIQTISLLAHLACDRGQWGPHLVVVPTSVMLNWEMEFKKFLPGFKILTYYGNQKERKEKRRGWNTENAFHVCVTSYQLVLADQHMFRRKPWNYMILDEAHHIKNFRSQRWQTLLGFNAKHRLLLTGTPLQNNLMELWSLLYFLMPHGLMQDGKGPFADHADFQAWFSNPMEKAIESGDAVDEETKATVNKLHTVLRPYLLRRLKAEVETQMPGKTESIVYCRLSKRQRFLYDDFMSRSQTKETLSSGQFLSIINCLMQLRKVCNHPDLFEVRPIVTSFAMTRSIPSEYEIKELLVRKRLLEEEPMSRIDWSNLLIIKPEKELQTSSLASESLLKLDAADFLPSLHKVPADLDLQKAPLMDTRSTAGWRKWYRWFQHRSKVDRYSQMANLNNLRCAAAKPFFGRELLHLLRSPIQEMQILPKDARVGSFSLDKPMGLTGPAIKTVVSRASELDRVVDLYGFVTPKVKAADMSRHALGGKNLSEEMKQFCSTSAMILHRASTKLSIAFPERSLLQYDCGKLQKLDELLRECKAGGHRVLIFTQMTKVLDILEIFLSFHGHRYLRLDGSTKIEQRQIITERFNSNDKILCFISSTRSGGLGINLQGADTVIFYDSDWNPALDRQCQDRAHRIGQTREVRIWRFVTEHSIEENMLKKANQKRRLDEMVIGEGDFTTDFLQKLDWRDYLDEGQLKELGVAEDTAPPAESVAEIRKALAAAEDEEDAAAAKAAEGELQVDQSDFSETVPQAQVNEVVNGVSAHQSERATSPLEQQIQDGATELKAADSLYESNPLAGTIDGFMVSFVEVNWHLFN